MAGLVQHSRTACRLLRPLASINNLSSLQQPNVASASTSGSCGQASTSTRGDEENRPAAPLILGRTGLSFRCFSSQTAAQGDRLREVAEVLKAPPKSLDFDRGDIPIPPDLDNALGRAMLKIMGFESKRSKLLHGAQRLYEAVTEQVDCGVLQRAFQTGKVFWSTYVLLSLYVWLVIHRLRDVRHADVKFFRQRFYNQFQQDVEFRVYAAGVQVGVTKWLKKLEEHFYETAFDFDKVLAPGSSETLADVILRKYYGGEEAHRADADLLARFALREMACLAATDEEAVLRGNVRFSSADLAAALERAGVTSAGDSTAGAAAAGATTTAPAAPAAGAVPAAGGAGPGSG